MNPEFAVFQPFPRVVIFYQSPYNFMNFPQSDKCAEKEVKLGRKRAVLVDPQQVISWRLPA